MRVDVVLFGASKLGQDFIENNTQYNVVCFVDNDEKKVGTEIQGVKVKSPTDLVKMAETKVIITSTFSRQISVQLDQMGIKHYEVYTSKKIKLYRDILDSCLFLFFSVTTFSIFSLRKFVSKKNIRTLHIMPKSGFSECFQAEFSSSSEFLIWDTGEAYTTKVSTSGSTLKINNPNLPLMPSFRYFKLMWKMANHQTVVVHAYRKFLVTSIGFSQGYIRIGWVAWGGGDIYASEPSNTLWNRLWKKTKAGFKHVFVFTHFDTVTLKNRYRYTGSITEVVYFNPLSKALNKKHVVPTERKEKGNLTKIVMIGHAAFPHLEHKKLLVKIPKINKPTLVLPISYGSGTYQTKLNAWLQTFDSQGANVVVITEYMHPDDYLELVQSIDIFILHSHDQVALSTLYIMLYLGKSVYLNQKNGVLWNHLVEHHGFKCFDYELVFNSEQLVVLTAEEKRKNMMKAKKYFDEALIFKHWQQTLALIS